jgi:hypothetical protein
MRALNHGGTKLMQSNYPIDRYWADTYMPAIEQLVRKVAHRIISFTIAPEQEDTKQATDYLITVETGKIACRVRRPQCQFRDFTIRAWRKKGLKTELSKIKEGCSRWYIYAWAKDSKLLENAVLVDLDRLRQSRLLERIDMEFWDTPPTIRYRLINGIDHRKNDDGPETGFVGIPLTMLRYHGCILEEVKN